MCIFCCTIGHCLGEVFPMITGGRVYPVRHYPVAIRLRDRNSTPHQFTKLVGDPVGRANLCVALTPRSGDSSGATLGVRSVALLHALCSPYYSVARTFF